jgi:hypothetical protein
MRNENAKGKRGGEGRGGGSGFGIARPSPACDEAFKGPLTKPQTDGQQRTTLGVKISPQRAAHLDLLPLLLLGSSEHYV